MKKIILILVIFSYKCAQSQIARVNFNERFNTLPVTNGLSLWFDAADVGSVVKDAANLVSLWQDKSGHDNHAVQSTDNNKPLWISNAQNGLPSITFYRTNADDADFFVSTKNGAYKDLFIVRNVADSATRYQYIFCVPANADSRSLRFNGGLSGMGNRAPLNYKGDEHYNDWYSELGPYRGDINVNGENTSITPIGNSYHIVYAEAGALTTNSSFSISNGEKWAKWRNRGISHGSGICEIITYDRKVTEVERRAIVEYLARKWGIQITPNISF